jgi:hypothetical protein
MSVSKYNRTAACRSARSLPGPASALLNGDNVPYPPSWGREACLEATQLLGYFLIQMLRTAESDSVTLEDEWEESIKLKILQLNDCLNSKGERFVFNLNSLLND